MLKLKFPYFVHLMQRADSFEKTLMLGMIREGGEGDEQALGVLMDREAWRAAFRAVSKSQT